MTTKNKSVTLCQNCGNSVHGFWKYGENKVCSTKCLRTRIANREIPMLAVERAYPELGILPPPKDNNNYPPVSKIYGKSIK